MIRINRHRIRSLLLGTGTVLTLLFTFLAILLILRTDPRDTSGMHLEKAQNLRAQAAEKNSAQALQDDLRQSAFREYLLALKSDPYNPNVWRTMTDFAENLPPALIPRMMTLQRQILAVETAESEKLRENGG